MWRRGSRRSRKRGVVDALEEKVRALRVARNACNKPLAKGAGRVEGRCAVES